MTKGTQGCEKRVPYAVKVQKGQKRKLLLTEDGTVHTVKPSKLENTVGPGQHVYLYYIVIFIRNKLFQTPICLLIYANQETLQYVAPKSVRFRIRHAPFILLLKTATTNCT